MIIRNIYTLNIFVNTLSFENFEILYLYKKFYVFFGKKKNLFVHTLLLKIFYKYILL